MVPYDVAFKLFTPEFDARFRRVGKSAATVPVPEAPVNEDDRLVPRQHDVRRTGQIGSVDPEPQTEPMEHRANSQFGLRVTARDA